MNIKLLDSHLRDYLKTNASAKEIAEKLSLTSVSIEKIEPFGKDFVYDIEVTTNRVDLASAVGIAREASAVLPQSGIKAEFVPPDFKKAQEYSSSVTKSSLLPLIIKNDPQLVHRICAVVMEVTIKPSPDYIKNRLEQAEIRSLNNVIDVTNYVMRSIGHPTHVFDYDRIQGHTINIRESKKGEEIVTLDGKKHTLLGKDIVAVDTSNTIIDLLGIMGLENSVVTDSTKRIVFFIDNLNIEKVRKTSMSLGIRSQAAQLNEKNVDPELAYESLLYGISLFEKIADGKVVSEIYDIYPSKKVPKTVSISQEKINNVIGIEIPLQKSVEILEKLGFKTSVKNTTITANVPSYRLADVDIPEDLVEEVARVYGYHNLPSVLPPGISSGTVQLDKNHFYWEARIKEALKYWGYTETYTYSFVSEELYEGPLEDAIELQNPLSSDWVYMRSTLIPSLLNVIKENKGHEEIRIFEIANTYTKKNNDLPLETRMLAGVIKKPHASFYEVKGLIEQLLRDLGIISVQFVKRAEGGSGADIHIGKKQLGNIEILDNEVIDFELNVDLLISLASNKKVYKPLAKYPPIVEDITFVLGEEILTGDVIQEIEKQSNLITSVTLKDTYESARTFHILYQHSEKNLTTDDVAKIREHVIKTITSKFKAEVK